MPLHPPLCPCVPQRPNERPGMIGKLDYLNRKYAYDSAVIQAQIAKYNLLQAIQSYEWVLNGLANAS